MLKRLAFTLIAASAVLSAAPQAIVFDFGGVLTTDSNREAVVEFLRTSFNLSQEEFERVNQEKRNALKAGKTDQEFWLEYAKRNNVTLPEGWGQILNVVLKDAIGVNPKMYALVDELKGKGVSVALLSNVDDRIAKLIRNYGLYDPFDPCLLSCELGLDKPDPKIYQVLLEKLNLPAKEIVFVDDKQENVDAAIKLGIDGILFTSPEQLQLELKKRELL